MLHLIDQISTLGTLKRTADLSETAARHGVLPGMVAAGYHGGRLSDQQLTILTARSSQFQVKVY